VSRPTATGHTSVARVAGRRDATAGARAPQPLFASARRPGSIGGGSPLLLNNGASPSAVLASANSLASFVPPPPPQPQPPLHPIHLQPSASPDPLYPAVPPARPLTFICCVCTLSIVCLPARTLPLARHQHHRPLLSGVQLRLWVDQNTAVLPSSSLVTSLG
jgi:hypothetical protein